MLIFRSDTAGSPPVCFEREEEEIYYYFTKLRSSAFRLLRLSQPITISASILCRYSIFFKWQKHPSLSLYHKLIH